MVYCTVLYYAVCTTLNTHKNVVLRCNKPLTLLNCKQKHARVCIFTFEWLWICNLKKKKKKRRKKSLKRKLLVYFLILLIMIIKLFIFLFFYFIIIQYSVFLSLIFTSHNNLFFFFTIFYTIELSFWTRQQVLFIVSCFLYDWMFVCTYTRILFLSLNSY